MASRFRTMMNKICGLDDRFSMLNERLTLIEETIGINNFMAEDTDKNAVGVGSTVPPDVARYQELKAKSGNVGVGSTAPSGNVGVGSTSPSGNVGSGNVGVGSTATSGTTETEPDTAVDGGQSTPTGNVGVGSSAPDVYDISSDPDFS